MAGCLRWAFDDSQAYGETRLPRPGPCSRPLIDWGRHVPFNWILIMSRHPVFTCTGQAKAQPPGMGPGNGIVTLRIEYVCLLVALMYILRDKAQLKLIVSWTWWAEGDEALSLNTVLVFSHNHLTTQTSCSVKPKNLPFFKLFVHLLMSHDLKLAIVSKGSRRRKKKSTNSTNVPLFVCEH